MVDNEQNLSIYQRWGKQMCIIQLLLNSIPGSILLALYSTHQGGPFIFGIIQLSVTLLLFILGMRAFSTNSQGFRSTFNVISIMSGSIIAAAAIFQIMMTSHACSLHQIAFRQCNNFEELPCAIYNLCTTDSMKEVNTLCSAPTQEICGSQTKLFVILGICATMSIGLNALPICISEFISYKGWENSTIASKTIAAVAPVQLVNKDMEQRLDDIVKVLEEHDEQIEQLKARKKRKLVKRDSVPTDHRAKERFKVDVTPDSNPTNEQNPEMSDIDDSTQHPILRGTVGELPMIASPRLNEDEIIERQKVAKKKKRKRKKSKQPPPLLRRETVDSQDL